MKYGETTRGYARYSQSFIRNNGYEMQFLAKGSKYEMRIWEAEQIKAHYEKYGELPPLNKRFR
jgi:hypothetical protein